MDKSNQIRGMPIHGHAWISSAQSYFCTHFRYEFFSYFELRANCLSDLQRNSQLIQTELIESQINI